MRLIPFERVVPDHRKIDNLADILVTEEGPGILSRLVDGALRRLAGDRDLRAEETTLYAACRTWCHSEGAPVMSSRALPLAPGNWSARPRPRR